jgi:hypothetical protein
MRDTQHMRINSGTTGPEEDGRPATRPETWPLPRWESFPVEDRCRLVATILQAARRQVEVLPTRSHPRN